MANLFGLKDLACILYDFDGVMTDNRVLVDQNGIEAVFVNRSDGYAVARLKERGIIQAIISTETNPVVECRGKKLNIPVIHGVSDKGQIVKTFCNDNGIEASKALFIGNDLNDLPAFKVVGFKGAPADAESIILKKADWVSSKKGGFGVVRDLYDFLCGDKE